ncbi:5-oxoprolinase [Cochliomyia hominivorax]
MAATLDDNQTRREGKYCFAIDRGGTFTDVMCLCPDGRVRTLKLLSEDPARYSDAPREGIRRILKEETGKDVTSSGLVDISQIGWIRMGTTVATNALLERKGDPVALVVNKGFRDLLYIGNQARPKIFDLDIQKPSNLYKTVVEVDCRIIPELTDGKCHLKEKNKWKILYGAGGSRYLEMTPVNEEVVCQSLMKVKDQGISSVAVVLAHNYSCPDHELKIGEIAKKLGFEYITLSHEAMPMYRLVPRGYTACAEAYLTPHVVRYLNSFKSGFDKELAGIEVLFMQSDGGLTQIDKFRASRAILSGPAGGVVGYAMTGSRETDMPLIGFDMGGTSTDVSRFAGTYEHVVESTTAGITVQAPQLDINTVAAGGGSRLFFRSGLFVVGPESAGAHPGPSCYKKGGPLTVTDANLILGRLLPQYFPKIFGPNENEPLDYTATKKKFGELLLEINSYLKEQGSQKQMTLEEVALGFIRVANEAMCRPIRALTQARGLDTSKHVLSCFGGAGGQHACAIARELGISKVLVHKYAGILSAYGMALADVVQEIQEPCGLEFSLENLSVIQESVFKLSEKCHKILENQGFKNTNLENFMHLRYEGTDCALMCSASVQDRNRSNWLDSFKEAFLNRYRTEFGFILHNRRIIVDDIRVRGLGKNTTPPELEAEIAENTKPTAAGITTVCFEQGILEAPIFMMKNLHYKHKIQGPAIIIDQLSTILVEPYCEAEVTKYGDLVINIQTLHKTEVDDSLDAIQLSIFSHRFMSIAEQMGRVLQRTSISTNIKERLDFSCALFGPDGGLVSNAPHIPVHLGAMQETVQYQLKVRGKTLKNGDVILSNHPQAGGSHLPDLTVITPVFYKDHDGPVFFVASRGHHADIGGITPGSMPPHSTSLAQEGASFKSFLIVENGIFQEEEVVKRFTTPTGAKGATGTRNLSDNISDLKAQIAANQKGIQLVSELIDCYGLNVVQAYMNYIQENAEVAVCDMLRQIAKDTMNRTESSILEAEEFMDDGSPIKLKVTIDADKGSAVCDFTGSGTEVWGNCNAPRAITLSALIYCLRCMVGHDVPLNQGCLAPIKVIIPKNSILDPSEDAAVVGGNVLTSQRIVDTVLKAFRVCAASQGCMNNVTIGDEEWGYYETVAGGAGAGPSWNGAGGVHSHMTNTRITDPEILELRYPMILQRFCLRTDQSGGYGKYQGGEGVERYILFRKPVTLSVLTERRTLQPYGMNGGGPGKRGKNLLYKNDGRIISLGSKTCIDVEAGDLFAMKTPGGGGYGIHSVGDDVNHKTSNETFNFLERGSVFEYRQSQESV